jgi:DNA polymerase-3 subunit gamma/tau
MNKNPDLNLARKHRPSGFETIIGQDLTVRLLKNSLYRQQFFPVYLLAGQRGCGKTTTGRVFAAALNCNKIEEFSKKPQTVVLPCEKCPSCEAMAAGNHPDFIEIDAASHTGVDNMRQIIEGSSFLPQLGRKKIYLIDEAHMLSKAAFNALLKILEEPPLSVIFMMATTDPHKIIDTVRSRCFQLFFEPVDHTLLVTHLVAICEQENLAYDKEGLSLVAWEAEGSVRDALNIVERIRLAHDKLTKPAVVATLGQLDDDWIVTLVERIAQSDVASMLTLIQKRAPALSAILIWKKLFEVLRAVLIIPFGEVKGALALYKERLQVLATMMPAERCIASMEMLYAAEQQFLKTTSQQELLELMLIKMAQHTAKTEQSLPKAVAPAVQSAPRTAAPVASSVRTEPAAQVAPPKQLVDGSPEALWQKFIATLDTLNDPLLASILKQGRFMQADATGAIWQIGLSKEMVFFQDTLTKTADLWQAALLKICEKAITLEFCFVDQKSSVPASTPKNVKQPEQQQPVGKKNLDLHDAAKWDTTHTLLRMFPGTVSELKEPTHE